MPRPTLIRTKEFPYHITSRSNHKLWFDVPMHEVWQIFLNSLVHASDKHPIEFHGGICMNNHYHMVVQTPDENIDQFMFEFNRTFSREIRFKSGLINRMLGKRYHWSLIDNRFYYMHVMKYLYRNPIKAGILESVEQYPYSSLYHQARGLHFPVAFKSYEDFSRSDAITWMNETHSENQNESIRNGLRKCAFKPTNERGKKVPPTFQEIGWHFGG